ncbi:hydroxyphenylacetyl-CoA thioesterase PaaI [Actibacterium sp. 188UL27-1]|uniref:hydroxyphenylacetyl-CoA thioesterase PaaI n=1 Tax=Actibacterium sp. 188UL27-1 TaxID=2786961 RepID=UPI001958834E|nr:hydroxyphenylacetyl-CoA thioesterase PaaI [Actibacterium sp. 188UL27-1]MBM7067382.1 hydroxyphenylacetyl-CoA thioesterase PaaI [Actibacterium sp. 188UL27-1]
MTPKERAQSVADHMWAADQASPWFGMELAEIDEGRAVLTLTVAAHHLNGHGICHGGVIFALADSAFAFACNSRNQSTVAQHNTITYISPAQPGDRLTASAREITLTGRSGLTDVTVTNQTGAVIAEFRGASRTLKGQVCSQEIET